MKLLLSRGFQSENLKYYILLKKLCSYWNVWLKCMIIILKYCRFLFRCQWIFEANNTFDHNYKFYNQYNYRIEAHPAQTNITRSRTGTDAVDHPFSLTPSSQSMTSQREHGNAWHHRHALSPASRYRSPYENSEPVLDGYWCFAKMVPIYEDISV